MAVLINSFAINDQNVWKGGHIILLGDKTTPPTWPDTIEDVINPVTFALATGWKFFTATDRDGFTLTPAYERDEGVPIDQRKYALRKGQVNEASWSGTGTSAYSDLDTMKKLWSLGGITAIPAAAGIVAQHVAKIGIPESLEEYMVAIIQQNMHPDPAKRKTRAWVFRKGQFTDPQGLQMSGTNASMNGFTIGFEPDPSQTDNSDFGLVFYED